MIMNLHFISIQVTQHGHESPVRQFQYISWENKFDAVTMMNLNNEMQTLTNKYPTEDTVLWYVVPCSLVEV
jgi:hypothetical protein